MKILHIIDSLGMGGAENLVLEMAPIQKNMGNDVAVLQLKESADKIIANKLSQQGIIVSALSASRSVRNIINIFALIPYLKKYDIVHAHLFPANYWVALSKILSRAHIPIVTTEHSTNNKRRKYFLFKYIDTFIYHHYNEIIACADKVKEVFDRYYHGISCISIPNGININNYLYAKPYSKQELINVSEDTFIITMVSRFIPSKRQDTLVRALLELKTEFHAVFVGGQPSDSGLLKIKKLSNDLALDNRVHFLYTRSDVDRILKSSDVVLLSSAYEGLSLSSIEGMACGRPFIASDVNGLREVVSGAGVLVKCGDAHELANVISKLESDKEYYRNVVSNCLKRASIYDIHLTAEKYMTEYNKFVKR